MSLPWQEQAVVVTGSSGSGKSVVTAMLAELGAATMNADDLAREVLAPGSKALLEVRKVFGDEVFDGDKLNRKALGRVVFSNPQLKAKLERIVHPRVGQLASERARVLLSKSPPLLVYDCPLYFESELRNVRFKKVVAVSAPEEAKVDRLVQRDSISRQEALKRLANQLPDSEKEKLADVVIHNDRGIEELKETVGKLYRELVRS